MKWYPWLRPSFEHLVGNWQAGRGHHAVLIHALPGMGDDALIYALSRWRMCQQPQGQKSCGECRACQLMQAGTHPDYYLAEPEKGKSTLGIDAIRDISEKLYDRARLGGAKVVWIKEAAQLTEAAANALLKTLEEPPENTWFLLGCRVPEQLPATLRSRCFSWHLAPPDTRYAEAWLARETQAEPSRINAALRLTGGAPAAALELLQPEQWQQRVALGDKMTAALTSGDWLSLLPALNHEQAPFRLHWLAAFLMDALKWRHGAQSALVNTDYPVLVAQLAQRFAPAVIQAMLDSLFRCRDRLLNVAAVNRELLLTELLLTWERYMRPDAVLPSYHL
ncbi:DNA polymerase III subunit delta' [Cronobacter sakazakii]|uniref:DNA polymerase III subunit delta' n=1 Tax=Cronobacter sakazakii TaxID=28141 RepID=UPI001AE7B21C|nr:DNA polymerase III subunit delta' [Cronobacter sakazakii]EKK3978918.1 DNA polymerase III subunit delta' [Cronobacter sakazakii]EKM6342702.1 DNA polymerase III subunit delta' [Cronobacter sakazakii]EKM6350639.1 DNA polymerase III subunit delta' [Cronobacter sakazakii]EKM6368587.1 DNA polymerase III subunit delta' [Cronobacter sakazakii]EKM6377162.1 DNA polymerase III subunit delta' [Cronobacter sakazakii]